MFESVPLAEAWAVFEAFLGDDRIVLADVEPAGLQSQWQMFAVRRSAAPKVWMDAYLAAFARTGGFELVTIDSDFAQYPGLRLRLLASSVG